MPPPFAVVITLSGEQEEGELQVDSTGCRHRVQTQGADTGCRHRVEIRWFLHVALGAPFSNSRHNVGGRAGGSVLGGGVC